MGVQGLAYIGVGAADLAAWRRYASDVLAMQVVEGDSGILYLRMDDQHHRIAVHEGQPATGLYYGWDVGQPDALEALTGALGALGYAGTDGTAHECAVRQVRALRAFTDPAGNRVELFYGQKSGFGWVPPRAHGGFKTGALGLGHVVMVARDADAMLAFYGALGLRMSDYIFLKPVQGQTYFMHCNPRHHSIAIVAGPFDALHHVMVENNRLDDVGYAYDAVARAGVPVAMTLGKHTNDQMLSFYMGTPSDFQIEYGWGAITIDDEARWRVVEYDEPSFWGHHMNLPA